MLLDVRSLGKQVPVGVKESLVSCEQVGQLFILGDDQVRVHYFSHISMISVEGGNDVHLMSSDSVAKLCSKYCVATVAKWVPR